MEGRSTAPCALAQDVDLLAPETPAGIAFCRWRRPTVRPQSARPLAGNLKSLAWRPTTESRHRPLVRDGGGQCWQRRC